MIKKLLLLLLLIPSLVFADVPEHVDFLIAGLTDSNNEMLNGGKIYTYTCGTTSNKTTWQDAGKSSTHQNPIILDGQGKKLVFADGCYKFRIDDANNNTLYTLDNLRYSQYNGSASYAGSTSGSSGAYAASLTPAPLTLESGLVVTFKANHTNTGAGTLNVNGIGASALVKLNAGALSAGDVKSGSIYTAIYDSSITSWVIVAPTFDDMSTWTPSPVSSAGSGTYTINNARCSKLGDLAFCSLQMRWIQASSSHASVSVTLPYAAKSKSGGQYVVGVYTEDASPALRTDGYMTIASGASTAVIFRSAASTVWPIAAGATNYAITNFFYETE